MAKKELQLVKAALEEFKDYDPFVKKLAEDRYFGRIRVFDSGKHKLNPWIRDRKQARVVLLLVEQMGKMTGRPARLNRDERKCLDGIGPPVPPPVVLIILFFAAGFLSDVNQNGIPDMFEGLIPLCCDTRRRHRCCTRTDMMESLPEINPLCYAKATS